MPTIELTEEQVRADAQLRGVLERIVANPEARTLLQRARKVIDPNAVIPELDAKEKTDTTMSDLSKKMDDFIAAQKKERDDERAAMEKASVEGRMEAGFHQLRQDGFTDEGIAAIKNLMVTEGITNVEVARSHFEKLNPPPAPVLPNGTGGFNFVAQGPDTSDDIKKLIETRGESASVLDKMARDALNEVRGVPRR